VQHDQPGETIRIKREGEPVPLCGRCLGGKWRKAPAKAEYDLVCSNCHPGTGESRIWGPIRVVV